MTHKLSRGASRIQNTATTTASAGAGAGATARYSIELPLPPKALSPNTPIHWREKARHVKLYREQCAYLMAELEWGAGGFIPTPVRVHLDFYLCRDPLNTYEYFPRDEDNARASFKAGN